MNQMQRRQNFKGFQIISLGIPEGYGHKVTPKKIENNSTGDFFLGNHNSSSSCVSRIRSSGCSGVGVRNISNRCCSCGRGRYSSDRSISEWKQ